MEPQATVKDIVAAPKRPPTGTDPRLQQKLVYIFDNLHGMPRPRNFRRNTLLIPCFYANATAFPKPRAHIRFMPGAFR